MTNIAAVVLAAGTASRYRAAGGKETSKLLALWHRVPLIRIVTQSAIGAGAEPVVVVLGYAAEAVRGAIDGLPVQSVVNPAFATGLASSLRTGLAALPSDCDGAFVLLGDMPGISDATLRALMACAQAHPAADAIVPTCGGRRGNPVLLARSMFGAAATLSGDAGARHLLRNPARCVVELQQDSDTVLWDIDLPEHLGP